MNLERTSHTARRRGGPRARADLRCPAKRGRACERPRALAPDHEAFADWFVSYWRRRGARVFAQRAPDEKAASKRAGA